MLSVGKTRRTILGIIILAVVLTSYTPFISGLRPLEKHEKSKTQVFECDTLTEYRHVYGYITITYVLVGTSLPVVLVFFFNFSIIHALITRKKRIFKQKFVPNSQATNRTTSFIGKSNSQANHKDREMLNTSKRSDSKNSFSSTKIRTSSKSGERGNIKVRLSKQNYKSSDRVSYMLILISVFFVGFNSPYIITWLWFFVPFKNNLLNMDQIYCRYGLVNLAEILHMINFSIDYIFYKMCSKRRAEVIFKRKKAKFAVKP